MKHATVVVAFFLAFAAATGAGGAIILVGSGEEHTTIESAITDANPGDVVQVLPGEYVENIVLKEGIEVVGAGAEQTVIRSRSESFPFATVDGKNDAALRGFTVTGGYYGIRCIGTSPTIADCIIWRNASCGISLEGSWPTIERCLIVQNPRYGVESLASSAPAISNCTFSANGYGVSSSDSSPTLTNCILWDDYDDLEGIADGNHVSHCDIQGGDFQGSSGNISADPGFVAWGPFNDSDNQLYVDVAYLGPEEGTQENPFAKVRSAVSLYSYHLGVGSPCLNAGEGGVHMGAYPDESPSEPPGSDAVLINVAPGVYQENHLFICHGAHLRGSESLPTTIVGLGYTAFFVLGRTSLENFLITGGSSAINCSFSNARVSNCVITLCGQNAVSSFYGNPTITRCYMSNNWESCVSVEGGSAVILDCFIGRHVSAGILCNAGSAAVVWNCVLTENSVGVSCAEASSAELQNCTVTDTGWKGIVSREGSSVTIVNSIVWGNVAGDLSQEDGMIEATFSNIGDGFPGEGNIGANPLFEEGPLGNFYLDSDSPCVDSGNGTAESLALNDRTTQKRSQPDSGTVDMGYHYRRFGIEKVIRSDGRISLEWVSTPGLDYTVLRASALPHAAPWETLGQQTAAWTRERYSFDEPVASAEFYRVGRLP